MKTKEIKEKFVRLLEENGLYNGKLEDFCDESFLELINEIDSLNLINLVINIENAFDIEFPDEYLNFSQFSSLDELCRVIEQLQDQ